MNDKATTKNDNKQHVYRYKIGESMEYSHHNTKK